MGQAEIFVAGTIVTAIVFTGTFMYLMFTFGKWADRDETDASFAPKQRAK